MKKPIYKRWWFWAIVVFVVGGIGSLFSPKEDKPNESPPAVAAVAEVGETTTEATTEIEIVPLLTWTETTTNTPTTIPTTASTTTTTKVTTSTKATTTSKPTTTTKAITTTKDNSLVVYRTPSGERYHYDPECGGKNSYETTLNKAMASGLTPCQKCVH